MPCTFPASFTAFTQLLVAVFPPGSYCSFSCFFSRSRRHHRIFPLSCPLSIHHLLFPLSGGALNSASCALVSSRTWCSRIHPYLRSSCLHMLSTLLHLQPFLQIVAVWRNSRRSSTESTGIRREFFKEHFVKRFWTWRHLDRSGSYASIERDCPVRVWMGSPFAELFIPLIADIEGLNCVHISPSFPEKWLAIQ